MIQYYTSFEDDFVETSNQSKTLPDNYVWIKKNPFYNILGFILFYILKLVGFFYAKFFLHLNIIGKDKLKDYHKFIKSHDTTQKFAKLGTSSLESNGGYYVYANHTQPLGDVFNPALYNPVHPYYVCNTSNLGIPILGPILPIVGALPIPKSISGKKQLFRAISTRAKQGNAIIIYPEAHLWPYYTGIRPFEAISFAFPIRDNLPVFTATTVYTHQKSDNESKKKPKITIYIDGPFTADETLSKKERIKSLHDQVYNQLKKRAAMSNYEYIEYKKVTIEKEKKQRQKANS